MAHCYITWRPSSNEILLFPGSWSHKIYPQILFESINKTKICLIHDIGSVKRFSFEMFKNNQDADIIIHGHTHRPSAEIFQKARKPQKSCKNIVCILRKW